MCYLKQNNQILQKRFPDIWDSLQETKNLDIISVESVKTREEANALLVTKGEEKIRLNSAYRPLQEAKKWADQYKFQNLDIKVMMFGFGNGILVRELLRRLAEDSMVFIYEPSEEIFSFVLENEDISDVLRDSRVHLFYGKNWSQNLLYEGSRVIDYSSIFTQIRCIHPYYDKLFFEEYNAFFDVSDRINEKAIVRSNTTRHFSNKAVENVVYNLPYIKESNYISEMADKIDEEVPAIVVAAGPSLDKNIDKLYKAVGKALIIATDTSIRVLEEKEIPYDCMITIDPGKPTKYMTDYPGCQEKPLFLCGESQNEIAKFHKGRKIWLMGSVLYDDMYQKNGYPILTSNAGGSVATAATYLAMCLGLRNIILIGQDLAFEGDRTHAGDLDNHITDEEKGVEWIEGIDGSQVKTRWDWKYYLKWFEDTIKGYPEFHFIDATEGGAKIHGSEILTLEKAIDQYCKKEFDFRKFLDDFPRTFEKNDYQPFHDYIVDIENKLPKIKERANQGMAIVNELIDRKNIISQKRREHLLKDLKKIDNFIAKQKSYELLEILSAETNVIVQKEINCMTGNLQQDEMNVLEKTKIVYEGMISSVDVLDKMMQDVLDKV